ncbi:preprotein translocase subunit SecE [Skermania piniformis]|uniref:Protein translocase subunit SecE n=1 Tax=Skermania pinensis TaxID=39122 RepID=A0ABX8S9M1_9ACTN|nr:preprotein translocase subunit SecE [Skermania piniformis]QXQ14473.1 preprotein translocase subunit SecE [Skermania piniformis]
MSDRDGDAADATGPSDPVSRPTGKRSGRRAASASAAAGDSSSAAGGVTTVVRARPESGSSRRAVEKPGRQNPFKRLRRFLREVVAELRKVIWPNRKQMVTYTTVVLVFVIFMVSYIGLLDLAFIKGVSWLFG